MSQEVDEFRDSLMHFGVKGMRWGVRKERLTELKEKAKLSLKDPRVRRAAIVGASVTAIVATAFIASHFSDTEMDADLVAKGAAKAKELLDEPTDIIYLTKPHRGAGVTKGGLETTPLRFVSEGQTKDYFQIFDRAGLNSDEFKQGDFKKMSNGDVATILSDMFGRVDGAGRDIPHAVLIPASKATGLDSIEDVVDKFGPELEQRYQDFLIDARKKST